MIYVKHPDLGNAHITEAELPAWTASGWVRWPRSAAQKNAAPQDQQEAVMSPHGGSPAPVGAAPEVKRKPGRPRKAA